MRLGGWKAGKGKKIRRQTRLPCELARQPRSTASQVIELWKGEATWGTSGQGSDD
jgi:hypothetical protein